MGTLILIIYIFVLTFTIWGIALISMEEEISGKSYIILPMTSIGIATIVLLSIYGVYYLAQQF